MNRCKGGFDAPFSRRALGVALACGLTLAVASPSPASDWDEEVVAEQTFEVGSGGLLDVHMADADVDVRAGSSERVDVVVKLRSRDLEWAREVLSRAELRVEADGDRVRIRSSPVRRSSSGRRGWQLLVTVHVPERFDLTIETGDGDVRAERVIGEVQLVSGDGDIFLGVAEGDALDLETADGDVVAKELSYSRVSIETRDGDVTIARLVAGEARLETSDGDIGVAELHGPLRARSGDGDLAVGLREAAEVSLGTGDGDILVRAAAGLGLTLQLTGESVVLETAGDRFEGQTSRESVKGALNGGGPRLSATSGDGQVVLSARGEP